MQLVHWPAGFLDQLEARGLRLILIDNRDAGLSDKHPAAVPPIWPMIGRALIGLSVRSPYRLRDMADDTAAVIEALELEAPAVLGISMGGMIAQLLALRHPERVGRLTLLQTTSGARHHRPKLRAVRALVGPPSSTREQSIARSVECMRTIGSPAYPYDAERQAAAAGLAFDRDHCPQGFGRQLAAITASGDRVTALRALKTPTLVVHGEQDPLIPISAGRELAELIPGAKLVTFTGWGHDLPEPLWGTLADTLGTWSRGD
ncbi:MAG: alpha/beta fold hydrolase [Planctomycetes bacterium]|nr:alpha/beta fold hydrolase [Planctomycetota bacterium]